MGAIATTYDGARFRSRLEARWAAFFDAIGWRWIYEPFDAKGYIPDFLVSGPKPLLVEVKPAVTTEDYERHTNRIDAALREVWNKDVLIVGVDPFPYMDSQWIGQPAVGWLGEAGRWKDPESGEMKFSRAWYMGAWTGCRKCSSTAVFHLEMSYACRPCGHGDGAHYLESVDDISMEWKWREAGNKVQWHAR